MGFLQDFETCKLISDLIINDTEFVDIGANIGLTTLGVQKLLKNSSKNIKKYHCFEPNNKIFSMLNYNTSKYEKINIYNFGISDKICLCNMKFSEYNNGCTYIYKVYGDSTDYSYDCQKDWIHNFNKENNIFVPLFDLDYIIDIFENVSIIKIDVEGFEYQVLKGAEKFLKKFKPIIVIEIFNCNFIKCKQLLEEYGYKKITHLYNEDYLCIF